MHCCQFILMMLLVTGTLAAGTIEVNPSVKTNVTGKDDLAQLKKLALSVGWDFQPNAETTAGLKKIGVRKIRGINVTPPPGAFNDKGEYIIDDTKPSRLKQQLKTCEEIGATPLIIMTDMPKALMRTINADSDEARVMGLKRNTSFGPTDYQKFREYHIALFEYVLIKKGFKNAVFEAFNEPDIGGIPVPEPPTPERGSAKLYDAMMRMYQEISAAAIEFEKRHPDLKVTLGGPALSWAYTFKYGSFNWGEKFLRDCAQKKLKLDFMSIHYYGNISSLHGEYKANYPSFAEMIGSLKKVRDAVLPGLPIQMNEWGPSYHVNFSPSAMVNASHIGCAWDADFLITMLENGIDNANFLVTTDLAAQRDGKLENVWGWCSFFVNPNMFGGKAWPKAAYNLITMISSLDGYRIKSANDGAVNTFAVADPQKKKIQILIWNYKAEIPEGGVAKDLSVSQTPDIKIPDAKKFFGSDKVSIRCQTIDENHANAYGAYSRGEPLTADNTALKVTDRSDLELNRELLSFPVKLSPSSVTLVEIEGLK